MKQLHFEASVLTLLLLQYVNGQLFLPSLVYPVPFTSSLSTECQVALLSSTALTAAFTTCGGATLLAMNSAPYQAITLPQLLPSLCHSNCTVALSAVRTQVDNCTTNNGAPFPILTQPNPIAGNMVNYSKNPFLDMFGGLSFSEGVTAGLVLQTLFCFHVDAKLDVPIGSPPPAPSPSLPASAFCATQVLQKSSNTTALEALGADRNVVCDASLKGCFRRLATFLGEAKVEASSVYAYFSPFASVLVSSLGKC
ncbi:hypothetical protein BC830DRAFT_1103536 [Chytriomyces sp. MP71]|nr:hypothetical protein BC830DRAFT_1103536 [Chytriomyces sp. MP71]